MIRVDDLVTDLKCHGHPSLRMVAQVALPAMRS
jgi:hypothetical protein